LSGRRAPHGAATLKLDDGIEQDREHFPVMALASPRRKDAKVGLDRRHIDARGWVIDIDGRQTRGFQ
jgi:hypothetical protein